jgi:lysophospholipase L1-like esterase
MVNIQSPVHGVFKGATGRSFAGCVLLFLLAVCNAAAQESFYLHDGERVVFYGDSITQQGYYSSFIEDYIVSRYPALNISFVNSGWSGDWVVGGGGGKAEIRVARDILAHHPTVVTLLLGMNDGGYQKFDQSFFDVFSGGYRQLVKQIQAGAPSVRLTLLETTPYEEITRRPEFEGYNATLIRYGKFVAELARENKQLGIDLNAPLLRAITTAKAIDPEVAKTLVPDRIHPSPALGMLMTALILDAWHGGAVVSSVEIDAHSGKILQAENTSAGDLTAGGALGWTQTDAALPLPIDFTDPAMLLVLRASDQIQGLDVQKLKVHGLQSGKYTLIIDGEKIGEWQAQELSSGVNLALVDTPMVRQARDVHAITRRLLDLRLARWQGIQVGLEREQSPKISGALKSLDEVQEELLAGRRSAASPRPHHFELQSVELQPVAAVSDKQ